MQRRKINLPPLYHLCRQGHLSEVRALLARLGDVKGCEWMDVNGTTALMFAVYNGHNSIVKLLLEQPSVKVNEKDHIGLTALHHAAGGNNAEGARMLLLHPTFNSANSTNKLGDTALELAVIMVNKEVLLELVKHESVSLDLPEETFDKR